MANETSLIRVSKKNKEIIQSIKIAHDMRNEDEALDYIISLFPSSTIKLALDKAHKEKTMWLHDIKEEI